MRKVRVDKTDGGLRCRRCGSDMLLARTTEIGKRRKHLKSAHCGQRQRDREPKHAQT